MLQVPNNIKELLHQDHCEKNIRIHFPNGERSDICNNLIVKDTVSFTESLCSQNTLKFGLCESPIFECEVVGVGNIKGATIEVFCEIHCEPTTEGAVWRSDLGYHVYPIPYGTFVVDSSKRQADMVHRKIIAYSVGVNGIIKNHPFFYELEHTILDANQTSYSISYANLACCMSNATKDNELIDSIEEKSLTLNESFEVLEWGSLYTDIRMNVNVHSDSYLIPYNKRDKLFYLETPPYFSESVSQYFQKLDEIKNKYLWDDSWYSGRNQFSIDTIYSAAFYGYFLTPQSPDILQGAFFGMPDYAFICPKTDVSYEESIYTSSLYIRPRFCCIKKIVITVTQGFGENPTILEQTEIPVRDGTFKVYEATLKSDILDQSITVERVPLNSKYVLDGTTDFAEYFDSYVTLLGMFCSWRREGYNFINIKQQFGLNPSDSLYPSASLHPVSVTGGKLYPEDYQSCWYDDYYTKQFGAIKCKYKNTSNEDVEYIYYLGGFNVDSDTETYQVYDLENNKVISEAVWTEAQIQAICETIADNIEGVSYMAVDFVGRGLPYVEAGDTFEILTKRNDSITTIVLNRTLTGEQTLTDSYKSV